jgi:hypothetical protein
MSPSSRPDFFRALLGASGKTFNGKSKRIRCQREFWPGDNLQPSHLCYDIDPLRAGRDAVRQTNFPALFALVHTQDNAGIPGRVIGRRVEKQKARAQLSHWKRMAAENQIDPDIGGMTALTA